MMGGGGGEGGLWDMGWEEGEGRGVCGTWDGRRGRGGGFVGHGMGGGGEGGLWDMGWEEEGRGVCGTWDGRRRGGGFVGHGILGKLTLWW